MISDPPTRPDEINVVEKSCDDKCRFRVCKHDFHWSEILSFQLLLIILSFTIIYTYRKDNTYPPALLVLCLTAAFYGNIVLWDISWIKSDAEYSRLIHNACEDIEKENMKMTVEMKKLEQNCANQKILTTIAAQQTADMAKQVGLVDTDGKLLNENMRKFEGLMDSPAFTGYHCRVKRVSKIQESSNHTNTRDNYYNDMIRAFKSATSGGDTSSLPLHNNRLKKRLKAAFHDYNNKCRRCCSQPIDVDKLSSMDTNGDSNIALWEFAIGIYKNVLQRDIGAEGQHIKNMEKKCSQMKVKLAKLQQRLLCSTSIDL